MPWDWVVRKTESHCTKIHEKIRTYSNSFTFCITGISSVNPFPHPTLTPPSRSPSSWTNSSGGFLNGTPSGSGVSAGNLFFNYIWFWFFVRCWMFQSCLFLIELHMFIRHWYYLQLAYKHIEVEAGTVLQAAMVGNTPTEHKQLQPQWNGTWLRHREAGIVQLLRIVELQLPVRLPI